MLLCGEVLGLFLEVLLPGVYFPGYLGNKHREANLDTVEGGSRIIIGEMYNVLNISKFKTLRVPPACTGAGCGAAGKHPIGSSSGGKVPPVEHETLPAAEALTPHGPRSCLGA